MMTKDTSDNKEDDEAWDPADHFVPVDHLVAKQRNKERPCSNNNNACPGRNIIVHSFDQLRADDDVDTRPSQACKTVEDSNCP